MDVVGADEVLYRGIRTDRNYYVVQEDGTVKISPMAFSDREHKPSVDRAHLCKRGPADTQKAPSDGITSLIAGSIRAISSVGFDVDVMPDPIKGHPTQPDNPAHALVFTNHPSTLSTTQKNKVFRRLQEALARLANERGWVIKPEGLR